MAVGSSAGACSLRLAFAAALAVALVAVMRPADAAWHPSGIVPTNSSLVEVLAAHTRADGVMPAGYANRVEHWTYVNGPRQLPVTVRVRGADVRADVSLPPAATGSAPGAAYSSGRVGSVRWRADANGIAHDIRSDLQGDAIDRLPEALFAFAAADCALIGETAGAAPAWVVAFAPNGRNAQWFFVEKSSGRIEKSISREGKVVITIAFDHFDASDGVMRARHWTVSDGDRSHSLGVTLDSVTRANVTTGDIAMPKTGRRVFAPVDATMDRIVLPARIDGANQIWIGVRVNGQTNQYLLDTGTASISLPGHAARLLAGGETLGHANVPEMEVGALKMRNVGVLSVPIVYGMDGILGYDFFFGHIVHIDYPRRTVEVLSHRVGDAVFSDPDIAVVSANVDQGLPIVRAVIGDLPGEDFALDTGSRRVILMQPFVRRFAREIAAHWTPQSNRAAAVNFLEGRIDVEPYEASHLSLGPGHFGPVSLGVNVPNDDDDAIEIPFDGIIGTDVLRRYELWFDYDNGRLAMRLGA